MTPQRTRPSNGTTTPEDGVSVILTYRATGNTIVEAVNSVLRQSHRALELLLVDDNDDVRDQIAALRARFDDPRIRFVRNPVCGRVNALNFGVEQARYDICAIIDDDDVWHPAKLASDISVLRRGDADLVCCPEILFRDRITFPDYGIPPIYSELSIRCMLVKNRVPHSSILGRKAVMYYDPDYPVAHDYELCLRILLNGGKIHKSDQPMVGVRVHNSNFNRPKSWTREFRHYAMSARMQARYIVEFGRYEYLVFPLLRILYTLVRRAVKSRQAEPVRTGALRWRRL